MLIVNEEVVGLLIDSCLDQIQLPNVKTNVYYHSTTVKWVNVSFSLKIDECNADSSNTSVNKRDVLWFINELKLRLIVKLEEI